VVGDKIEINCVCDDESQLLIWRFKNGSKVPRLTEAKNTANVYFRRSARNLQARKKGSTLVIPEFSVDLNQTVFRCQRDAGRKANPKIDVTLFGKFLHEQYISKTISKLRFPHTSNS